jgi:hypothetical protein
VLADGSLVGVAQVTVMGLSSLLLAATVDAAMAAKQSSIALEVDHWRKYRLKSCQVRMFEVLL